MSGIARDSVTIWRTRGEGAGRLYVSGCRVEDSEGADAGQAGPVPSREIKAYFFGDVDVREGDWMVPGVSSSEEPPEDARRVSRVSRWSMRHRLHHLEVTAR